MHSINNTVPLDVNEYKYLGITIKKKLKCGNHIKNIGASALRNLELIKWKLKTATAQLKLLAYKFLIRPKLDYRSGVWDPCTKKGSGMIERVCDKLYLW